MELPDNKGTNKKVYRSKDILSMYVEDIKCHKVLNHEEEIGVFGELSNIENKLILKILPHITDSGWEELKVICTKEDYQYKVSSVQFDEFRLNYGVEFSNTIFKMIRLTDEGKKWQESCLNEIRNNNLLSKFEEKQIKIYQNQIQKIKAKFVSSNLRLVISMVRRYSRSISFHTPSDLVQEGNLGLMKAVDKYDVERGLKFSTYAVWWIRQSFNRTLDDNERTVRTPVHQLEIQRKMRALDNNYYSKYGRSPTDEEYSSKIDTDKRKIQKVISRRINSIFRIDLPIGDGNSSFHDVLFDEEAENLDDLVSKFKNQERMHSLLLRLTPQESLIIRKRFGLYGDPLTLAEVGESMGVTRERIRQIEAIALRKLKSYARDLDPRFT